MNTEADSQKVDSEKSNVSDVENIDQVSENNLTALSFRGNNTFMPDTIFEWFFTVLFILAIIILIRLMARRHNNDNTHH